MTTTTHATTDLSDIDFARLDLDNDYRRNGWRGARRVTSAYGSFSRALPYRNLIRLAREEYGKAVH